MNREPESKQILDPQSRAGQKWQRIGCLTSGRAYVNKHRLYGPLLDAINSERERPQNEQ